MPPFIIKPSISVYKDFLESGHLYQNGFSHFRRDFSSFVKTLHFKTPNLRVCYCFAVELAMQRTTARAQGGSSAIKRYSYVK